MGKGGAKIVGTGITKHERISITGNDPISDENEKALNEYVEPKVDFLGYLKKQENHLNRMLKHFGLPLFDTRVFARANHKTSPSKEWHYCDSSSHTLDGFPSTMHSHWFLRSWPYQSSFWYLGEIGFRLSMAKHAFAGDDANRLAGSALRLGEVKREFSIKFSRLHSVETKKRQRADEALDKHNAAASAKAQLWRDELKKYAKRHWVHGLDISKVAAAKLFIKHCEPKEMTAPSVQTVRKAIAELGNTGVIPTF